MAKVSIVIPCRNEASHIASCLDSILANTFSKEDLEIWVVDGRSTDDTVDIVKVYMKEYPFIKLIENPRMIAAAAMNIGIQNANGEILMRMDAHARYSENYIEVLVSHLEMLDCDNVGGIWITRPSGQKLVQKGIALSSSHPFGIGDAWYKIGSDKVRQVDTVPYGCYRMGVFERIGVFDEELVRNQDDEFNARLIRSGGRIYLVPEAIVEYYARDSICKIFRMFFDYGLYKPLVNIKIGRVVTLRQLIPPVFLLYCIALLAIWLTVPEFLLPASILLGIYMLLNLLFSVSMVVKSRDPGLIVVMPPLFFIIHIAYGSGYLMGLFRFVFFGSIRKMFQRPS